LEDRFGKMPKPAGETPTLPETGLLLGQAMKRAQAPDQLAAIDGHDAALRENFREG
jgi:hypothetical protein